MPFSVRFLCRSNSPFVRFCGGTRFLCVAPILLRAPSKRPHPRRLSPSGCPGAAGGVPGGRAGGAAAPDAQQHCDVCPTCISCLSGVSYFRKTVLRNSRGSWHVHAWRLRGRVRTGAQQRVHGATGAQGADQRDQGQPQVSSSVPAPRAAAPACNRKWQHYTQSSILRNVNLRNH